MSNQSELPQLWRAMCCQPERSLTSLKKNTGDGSQHGDEKGDFLATQCGWMGYTLYKRLEFDIITQKEYNIAMNDYHAINDNIDEIKSDTKKRRYLDKNRLCIPEKKRSDFIKSDYVKRVEQAIIDLSKEKKGLFTYATISEKIGNTRKGAKSVGTAIRKLWEYYYDRSDIYYGF